MERTGREEDSAEGAGTSAVARKEDEELEQDMKTRTRKGLWNLHVVEYRGRLPRCERVPSLHVATYGGVWWVYDNLLGSLDDLGFLRLPVLRVSPLSDNEGFDLTLLQVLALVPLALLAGYPYQRVPLCSYSPDPSFVSSSATDALR